jgi:hypothetical protein
MTHLFTRSPNKAKSIFPRPSVLAASVPSLGYALTLTIVLNLTGCGDAGPTPTSSLIQGRWASTALTPAYIAVVVPASTGANTPAVDTVWALAQDASRLYRYLHCSHTNQRGSPAVQYSATARNHGPF